MRAAGWTCLMAILLLVSGEISRATTWAPRKATCPLCKTENAFQAPMSYGSYVYSWPSKFQLVFWPATESASLYSCSSCRLTCFMSDFKKVPEDKTDALRKVLEGTSLTPAPAADKEKPPRMAYERIPILDRLAVARKVYEVLGQDDAAWCGFNRVVGYHAHLAGKAEAASEARQEALTLAQKIAGDPRQAGKAREYLVIAGAMHYFLGKAGKARAAFETARPLEYRDPANTEDAGKGKNEYLTILIGEYTEVLDGKREIPDLRKPDTDPAAPPDEE